MRDLLARISGPADLRTFSAIQRKALAEEIREVLVEVVTENGGHLASNLGVVELTIALHHSFDSPTDKIVWDVSHQSYVHKLLTGRADRFHALRQFQGISGFTSREESPHDQFGAGHASTSISAALGMAVARDLKGEGHHVVAIIGDGAMTGGMAFEAINNAGHIATPLIVVLNDNEMSISPNVGGLSIYLNGLRSDPRYFQAKADVERTLMKLSVGRAVLRGLKRLKHVLKGLLIPTLLWEDLGLTYLGPIDGHDTELLIETFKQAKRIKRPVLVHVVTVKGKGYEKAEQEPVGYHGIAPSHAARSLAPSYTQVFGRTLVEIAEVDPRVVAVTAAMAEGTGLREFATRFPFRFFDVGIAEPHAVTFAAGLATQGMIPVVAIYSTFMQRAFDQVIHDVCIQRLPVVLAMDRGGLVGDDGRTHHGAFDLSFLRTVPNLVVMAPADENELRQMLAAAVGLGRPVAVRYPRGTGVGVPLDPKPEPLAVGEAEIVHEGTDGWIVGIGSMVHPSIAAVSLLEDEGYDVGVVNARFAKPLDGRILGRVLGSGKLCVTVEENALVGGFGSAVLEWAEENRVPGANVVRVGIQDRFVEHGPPELLRHESGLSAERIADRVEAELRIRGIEPRAMVVAP